MTPTTLDILMLAFLAGCEAYTLLAQPHTVKMAPQNSCQLTRTSSVKMMPDLNPWEFRYGPGRMGQISEGGAVPTDRYATPPPETEKQLSASPQTPPPAVQAEAAAPSAWMNPDDEFRHGPGRYGEISQGGYGPRDRYATPEAQGQVTQAPPENKAVPLRGKQAPSSASATDDFRWGSGRSVVGMQ